MHSHPRDIADLNFQIGTTDLQDELEASGAKDQNMEVDRDKVWLEQILEVTSRRSHYEPSFDSGQWQASDAET